MFKTADDARRFILEASDEKLAAFLALCNRLDTDSKFRDGGKKMMRDRARANGGNTRITESRLDTAKAAIKSMVVTEIARRKAAKAEEASLDYNDYCSRV